jgi:CYTH domain-containing protein
MTLDKYSRIERERRFLLEQFPADANVLGIRRITDRYIDGTSLRLREMKRDGAETIFKLTKKVPEQGEGAQQGLITTIRLTREEFCLLSQLPAQILAKTRYSVPPFGIDVFEGALEGLILAEAEFESAAEAGALAVPTFVLREVSNDIRFTGGLLARTSREELGSLLLKHGVTLAPSSDSRVG